MNVSPSLSSHCSLGLDSQALSARVIPWYNTHQRSLPWRATPFQKPDPYAVWLSEMMLQQTTVTTVMPYFLSFIKRWPTFKALSEASLDDILHSWQGLGYYARAKNLYKTAQLVNTQFKGKLPEDLLQLQKLPGIGPYTAGAIAAIAFNQSTSPIDGNIIRILSRIYAIDTPLPLSRPFLHELARYHTPKTLCGDYIQGLMDLGATLCRPHSPLCHQCPLNEICKSFKQNNPQDYPCKLDKKEHPERRTTAYWVERPDGAILLNKRPLKGLLGGMVLVPTSPWNGSEEEGHGVSFLQMYPHSVFLPKEVSHVFTHFKLQVTIAEMRLSQKECRSITQKNPSYFWCFQEEFSRYPLPSLMRKIIKTVHHNK